MPTIVGNKHLEMLTQEYVPLEYMMKIMKEQSQIPYSSRFSFMPYLDAVSGQMCTACPNTKGLLTPIIKDVSDYIESGKADLEELKEHDHFKAMVSLVVPSMFFKDDRSFISPPFKKEFIVSTPAFQEMFDGEKWELKVDQEKFLNNKNKTSRHCFIYILNTFYNQDIDLKNNELVTLRNKETGIERHYQIDIKFDFVAVKDVKKIPKLSQIQINKLISNLDDEEYVLKYLPADHFEFSGFALGNFHDVSEIEVLSQFKHWINIGSKDLRAEQFLQRLTEYIQSYLDIADIRIGSIMTEFQDVHRNEVFSLTDYPEILDLLLDEDSNLSDGIYGRMIHHKKTVIVENLPSLKETSFLEKRLL